MSYVKIIECPRDAMQGIHDFIPTQKKVSYIQSLLKVGFDTIDVGSFVSEKAIPQMKDSAEVLAKLDLTGIRSKLLVIIANSKGARISADFAEITYLGFPFSISEMFQKRNTNASMEEALKRVDEILEICEVTGKQLVIYISMAFGNPYGEKWDADIAAKWVEIMIGKGVKIISLADTIGTSTPENITYIVGNLIRDYPAIEFGAHLHSRPTEWKGKMEAAWAVGCRRFDGAIRGLGGCPMATDELVGNMPTENILSFLDEKKIETGLNMKDFGDAMMKAQDTFL